MHAFQPKQKQRPQRTSSTTAKPDPAHSIPHQEHPILNLQRTIGNQAVLRLMRAGVEGKEGVEAGDAGFSGSHGRFPSNFAGMPVFPPPVRGIQRKLTVNAPGDAYEQEADRVAEQVMRMPDPAAAAVPAASGGVAGVQRACACGGTCDDCKKEHPEGEHAHVQMKTAGPSIAGTIEAPPIAHEVLRSPGQPLDVATRAFMEPRFGWDFSKVRVHADERAAESAQAVQARAYTVGRDVVFGAGEFMPGTEAGQRLMGHELVHVVQQGSAVGLSRVQPRFGGPVSDSVQQARPTLHTEGRMLSRQPAPPRPLLTSKQAAASAADVTKTFDENSIRFIKFLANLTPSASFSDADAEALAQKQHSANQRPTGRITKAFLDLLLPQAGNEVAQNALIHLVINHAKLNVSTVLAVRFDPSISTESDIKFFPGGVAEVLVGSTAFATYDKMVAAIKKQLAKKPAAGTSTAVPKAVLDKAADQTKAISANKVKFTDPRLIQIVQGAVGNKPTGGWDVDTVRHIAAQQQLAGLTADGTLDDKLLEVLVTGLVHGNNQDAALYLIIGFYRLNPSHAFSIRFDPAFQPPQSDPTAVAETTQIGLGVGGVVRIGPGMPIVNVIQTLAHELGHVEQVVAGISSLPEREFLSRVVEIQSQSIPELPIESADDIALIQSGGPPSSKGFLVLANQTLHFWQSMTTAQKRTHLAEFRAIRQIVINRTGNATQLTPAQKTGVANLWNAADASL